MQAQTTHELNDNEGPFLDPAMLLEVISELKRQLYQARSIATLLEAECANCWGPIHKDALEQAQALTRIEEATDVEG
jgi:hypothetical protein